jgi:hypothetical protein
MHFLNKNVQNYEYKYKPTYSLYEKQKVIQTEKLHVICYASFFKLS